MPNFKGGKKYKSSKHSEGTADMHEIGEGQLVGRVINILGNRNMMVYCNDDKERIAHIRGGLRKKVARIEKGDIVLLSLRSEGMGLEAEATDKSDILAKYEREVYSQLRRVPGINRKLFLHLENMDARSRSAPITSEEDMGGFTFEDSDTEEEEDGDGDQPDDEEAAAARAARKKEAAKKLKEARSVKESGESGRTHGDEDIDIDAI